MARNTTRQGANFELDVLHYLETFGYDGLRSSGSRGAVDVVAVGPLRTYECGAVPDAEVLFIQCKITNPVIPPAERLKFQDWALRAGAVPLVAFKQADENTRRVRPHFRRLTGPGPKDWASWTPGKDHR